MFYVSGSLSVFDFLTMKTTKCLLKSFCLFGYSNTDETFKGESKSFGVLPGNSIKLNFIKNYYTFASYSLKRMMINQVWLCDVQSYSIQSTKEQWLMLLPGQCLSHQIIPHVKSWVTLNLLI